MPAGAGGRPRVAVERWRFSGRVSDVAGRVTAIAVAVVSATYALCAAAFGSGQLLGEARVRTARLSATRQVRATRGRGRRHRTCRSGGRRPGSDPAAAARAPPRAAATTATSPSYGGRRRVQRSGAWQLFPALRRQWPSTASVLPSRAVVVSGPDRNGRAHG